MSKVYPKTYPKTYAKVYGKVNPPVSTIYPSNIASNTEWWDIQDLSTMWQESSKTTPAAVDQPIGYIESKSGSGNDFQQSVAAKRPILRHDGTSYYIEGNGTMYMTIPSSTASFKYLHNSTGGTALMGMRWDNAGTYAVIFDNCNAATANVGLRCYAVNTDEYNVFVGRGTPGTSCVDHTGTNSLLTKAANHFIKYRFDVAETPDFNVAIDGTDSTFNPTNSANAGPSTLDFTLFANAEVSGILNGRCYDLSMYNATLTTSEYADMQTYYNGLLGL